MNFWNHNSCLWLIIDTITIQQCQPRFSFFYSIKIIINMKLMNRFNFILYFFQMFLLFKKNYIRIGKSQNVIVGIKSNRSFNQIKYSLI